MGFIHFCIQYINRLNRWRLACTQAFKKRRLALCVVFALNRGRIKEDTAVREAAAKFALLIE